MKLNTTNRANLPSPTKLRELCKSLALLDAILCPEWEYRYYAYNCKWSDDEEFFQMRDGEGNDMLILLRKDGVVINGFEHELYDYEENQPSKEDLTLGLPPQYNEFVFGEPVTSIGSTYCIWTNDKQEWTIGKAEHEEDGSEDQLHIFDNNPETYTEWAINYYFDGEESKMTSEMKETIKYIYQGKTLTKEMVTALNSELDDWKLLEEDLQDISYPYTL